MLRRVIAGVAVAVMLASAAMAGPWEDGVDAYNRGDYATALRLWRPLAEQGDARAENNLGVLYEKRWGVTQDDGEVVRWYGLAAEHGHPDAEKNLKDMYADGRGENDLALSGADRWAAIASRENLDKAISIASQ